MPTSATLRNVNDPESEEFVLDWDEISGKHDPRQRFVLYRLCGSDLQEVATCESPEAAGLALVELGREGEWDECPVGLLDRLGEVGQKWILRPWLPSPRVVMIGGGGGGGSGRKLGTKPDTPWA